MYRLIAPLLLLPASALAQTPPPPDILAPSGAGFAPHICPYSHYPKDAVARNEQGTVTMAYTVAADGSVQNVTIAKSSGYDDLDQAAMACATAWKYKPASKDGQPIAVPWKSSVAWAINGPGQSGDMPARREIGSGICTEHPSDPNDTATPTVAVVWYFVETDGSVSGARLGASSGDKVYDDYAVSCVSGWHFRPAEHDNVPVKTYTQAAIRWSRF
jgi:TonB family protein